MAGKPDLQENAAVSTVAEAPPPHYHGHRKRLRARFRQAGAQGLAEYELLELVLFRALPRRDVKPIAKKLLEKFGSFAEVISAPPARLAEVAGLGEEAITDLKIVQACRKRALARRLVPETGALVVVGGARLLPHGHGVCR
jgi:DNA repair protein RadC